MNALPNKRRTAHCVALIIVLTGGMSLGQYATDLVAPNSIPCYCQETSIWCGAATAQMVLEGYPGGVNHVYTQTQVWNTIQTYVDDPGLNWATDPDGMRETLMDLGAGTGVNWVIHAKASREALLYSVAYWMAKRKYPVPTLVYGFGHWVLITGVTTDVDPVANSTVSLQLIRIFNPWNNPCPTASSGGVDSTMSDSQWFTSYWYSAGNYSASKWNGNYIAVIEPPVQQGWVRGDTGKVNKGQPISPNEAIDYAYQWLDKYKLLERYKVFTHITPLEPLLVNTEPNGYSEDEHFSGYYVVPFGYEAGRLSHGAVLVNAFTGEFQEAGTFSKPRTLLRQEDAVRLALSYIKCNCDAQVMDVHPKFQPSMETNTPFLPVWQVTLSHTQIGVVTLLVNMEGIVSEQFTQLPPGD